MNILLDILPESVCVNGEEFFIDTDFRTFIIFEKLVLDESLSAKERIESIIRLVYTDTIPNDIDGALNEALKMYRCGAEVGDGRRRSSMNGNVELKPKRIYDYEHDAPYIYAAFLAQYGIDLNEIEYLHWWKFQALFNSLTTATKIVEIMGYRGADLSKVKDQNERARLAKLKRMYELPTNYTFEDKVAMAGAAFGGVSF